MSASASFGMGRILVPCRRGIRAVRDVGRPRSDLEPWSQYPGLSLLSHLEAKLVIRDNRVTRVTFRRFFQRFPFARGTYRKLLRIRGKVTLSVYYTPMFAGFLYRVTFTFWGGIRVTLATIFALFTWIWTYYTPIFFGETDAFPDTRAVRFALDEALYCTPIFHGAREQRLAHVVLALVEAPRFPRPVQFRPRHLEPGAEPALVPKEPLDHVGVLSVLGGRGLNSSSRAKPVRKLLHAPPGRPSQHAGQLLPQLLGEFRVRLTAVEALGEGDQLDPVRDRLRPVGDLRLVVRRKPDLELPPVAERSPVRRAGADRVVARDLLYDRLLQLHLPLGLRHPDEPDARELGELVLHRRIPVPLLHDGVRVGNAAVVAHEVLEELDQRAL